MTGILGWGLGLALAAATAAEGRLTVAVYNLAGVPPGALAEALETAERIFEKAGIRTEWVECPRSPEGLRQYPKCEAVVGLGTPSLKIISHTKARQLSGPSGALGFAAMSERNGFASQAFVFFHRVEEEAAAGNSYVSVVLGHAMAHELGHLLLGAGHHSRTGIMRETWLAGDLRRAERGELGFSPSQANRMREQVEARMRFQATAQTARGPK